jgi:hypothetical protein
LVGIQSDYDISGTRVWKTLYMASFQVEKNGSLAGSGML